MIPHFQGMNNSYYKLTYKKSILIDLKLNKIIWEKVLLSIDFVCVSIINLMIP